MIDLAKARLKPKAQVAKSDGQAPPLGTALRKRAWQEAPAVPAPGTITHRTIEERQRVYRVIADAAKGNGGECYLSTPEIANQSRLSLGAVERVLERLIEFGDVHRIRVGRLSRAALIPWRG
jgi:hypothetical protein